MKWLKNRVGQGFIFQVIISAHYCILFSENVKEPSHFSILESKLWHNKTETKNVKVAKMVEFIKACNQYPRKFNFSHFFRKLCSEEMDNFLLPGESFA